MRLIELSVTPRFLWLGYKSNFQVEAELSNHLLSECIELCVNNLLTPIRAFSDELLPDIKGRDSNLALLIPTSVDLSPIGEEIFFVSGLMPSHLAENEVGELSSYRCDLLTQFDSFEGDHHIQFKTSEKRAHFPASIPLSKLGSVIPVRPTHFRLGIEVFHSKRTVILGYAPVASELLLIEARPDLLRIKISSEVLKNKSDLPLDKYKLFDKVSDVFYEIFAVDLRQEYLQRL
ncbi:MAG: hypothetical protein KDD53_00065 [Bdellovibrionales bacterium]|nr:hypothetical protein [Bdellovibrionales bacterium]